LTDVRIGHERVIRHDAHAERAGAPRHLAPDFAHPDNPQRLAREFDPRELCALPLARAQRAVCLRDVARQREQVRHRQFRSGDGIALRRVDHHDAALRGGVHIDVVHADARAPNNLQAHAPAR
jgi:hypothetical protein